MKKAIALTGAFFAMASGIAYAADGSGKGQAGQTLQVSKVKDLKADGETITVKGSGFDQNKGIYVALCQDNGPGKKPGPCGGGADMSGKGEGSKWISSNPPSYAKGLTTAFGEGGTFQVRLSVKEKLSDSISCKDVKCAIFARADHTRGDDRSLDVPVPVTFTTPTNWVLFGGGGAAAVVIAGGAAFVLLKKRKKAEAAV